MILELIATGLLAYGISVNCTHVTHDNNYCNSDNSVVENVEPDNAVAYKYLSGAYNFHNLFEFEGLYSDIAVRFEPETTDRLVRFCPHETSPVLYLRYISFEIEDDGDDGVASIYCYFSYYSYDFENETYTDGDFALTVNNNSHLSDLYDTQHRSLFFYISSSFVVDDDSYYVFNEIFTHNDNQFVTSYTGYYNFNYSRLLSVVHDNSTWQPLSVVGSISWQYQLFTYMTIWRESTTGRPYFDMGYYDVEHSAYWREYYDYDELTSTYANVINNLYFTGVKMSVRSQNLLATVGTFAYASPESTPQPQSFHDLLFTIMDVPVYFITQFFNFELFGMNLYVAFAGLVTLAVAIFIIRIIWKF